MNDSMYSAMFGAMTQEHRMGMIANNLANANTTGYKKDQLAFKDVFLEFAHDTIMEPILYVRDDKLFPEPITIAKPRIALSEIDFEQGSLKSTGAPLDVAITGKGFFKVETPDGDRYTRNGHFVVNAEGQLVTMQGYPVLGDGGPIEIPPNARVVINEAGQIFAGEDQVGQFDLADFEDQQALEKLGQNLFRLREGREDAEIAAEGSIQQGYLEAANINVVEEMVNMIETQRQFEAYQKMIQTTQDLDNKAVTQVGRSR